MDKEFANLICLIIQKYERVTGQRCYFLPKERSGINCELSEKNCPDFCFEIAKSPCGHYHCRRKRRAMIASAISRREPIFSICHIGLYEIIIPVFSGTSVIGVFNAFFKLEALPNNIIARRHIYEQKYRCDVKILLEKLGRIASIHENLLQSTASLLNSLVLLHIPLEPPSGINRMKQEDNDLSKLIPWPLESQALTKIIEKNNEDLQAYRVLNEVLIKAFDILLITIQNGHLVKAKELYESIFKITYLEKDLESQKGSAQFLIYKCNDVLLEKTSFIKEVYDRTNPILDNIQLAQNITEMNIIIGDYFDTIVQIYQIVDKDKNPLVNKIVRYIDTHYDRPFTIKEMAKSLNISSTYANRIFAEQMGVNLRWYINETRMNHAQHYLRDTNWPISTVALKVGYSDVRTFYKMFNQHFSISCAEFRNLYCDGKTEYAFPSKNSIADVNHSVK